MWILIRDYGFDGLGEPLGVWSSEEAADEAKELIEKAAPVVSIRKVEVVEYE